MSIHIQGPERAKELLPLIQALAEGKLQERSKDGGIWRNVTGADFSHVGSYEWRVKPEARKIYLAAWLDISGFFHCAAYQSEHEALLHKPGRFKSYTLEVIEREIE